MLFLISCMGGGNQILEEGTFGLTMQVKAGAHITEVEPDSITSDLKVRIITSEGIPSAGTIVVFNELTNYGVTIYNQTATTNSQGIAAAQIKVPDQYNARIVIRAELADSSAVSASFLVETEINNECNANTTDYTKRPCRPVSHPSRASAGFAAGARACFLCAGGWRPLGGTGLRPRVP